MRSKTELLFKVYGEGGASDKVSGPGSRFVWRVHETASGNGEWTNVEVGQVFVEVEKDHAGRGEVILAIEMLNEGDQGLYQGFGIEYVVLTQG